MDSLTVVLLIIFCMVNFIYINIFLKTTSLHTSLSRSIFVQTFCSRTYLHQLQHDFLYVKCYCFEQWLASQSRFSFYISPDQSFTMRADNKSPNSTSKACSKMAAPTPPKRRNSILWSEMLDVNMKETLSTKEIKRQEVCFKLSLTFNVNETVNHKM